MPNNLAASLQSIDLSNPDMHQSATLIKQACMESGIFYVKNHGISEEFMSEVFNQIKKFFGLPLNEKKKLPYNENQRGYQQTTEYSEAFSLGATLLEDDPTFVWPPSDLLYGWKETMKKYHRETLNVGRAIMKIIALALEIDVDFFEQPSWLGGATSNFSTILHYAVPETDPAKERLGSIPHTDSSLLTLLATEGVMGLQLKIIIYDSEVTIKELEVKIKELKKKKICRNTDAKPQVWENVLPIKGAFIVNVGDMLERLSNGTFRSALHRVVYNQKRYSTTVFVSPLPDAIIECLPTCTSKENPPKYPAMTCSKFLKARFEKFMADYEREDNTKA